MRFGDVNGFFVVENYTNGEVIDRTTDHEPARRDQSVNQKSPKMKFASRNADINTYLATSFAKGDSGWIGRSMNVSRITMMETDSLLGNVQRATTMAIGISWSQPTNKSTPMHAESVAGLWCPGPVSAALPRIVEL